MAVIRKVNFQTQVHLDHQSLSRDAVFGGLVHTLGWCRQPIWSNFSVENVEGKSKGKIAVGCQLRVFVEKVGNLIATYFILNILCLPWQNFQLKIPMNIDSTLSMAHNNNQMWFKFLYLHSKSLPPTKTRSNFSNHLLLPKQQSFQLWHINFPSEWLGSRFPPSSHKCLRFRFPHPLAHFMIYSICVRWHLTFQHHVSELLRGISAAIDTFQWDFWKHHNHSTFFRKILCSIKVAQVFQKVWTILSKLILRHFENTP